MLDVRMLAVASLVAKVTMGGALILATEPNTAAQELVEYRSESGKRRKPKAIEATGWSRP